MRKYALPMAVALSAFSLTHPPLAADSASIGEAGNHLQTHPSRTGTSNTRSLVRGALTTYLALRQGNISVLLSQSSLRITFGEKIFILPE